MVNTSACHAEDRGFKSLRNRHFLFVGSVAQSVEHRTENPGVGSSILPGATILIRFYDNLFLLILIVKYGIILVNSHAPVAQLDRVFGYEPKG